MLMKSSGRGDYFISWKYRVNLRLDLGKLGLF